MTWWWVSYAQQGKCNGVVIVEGETEFHALMNIGLRQLRPDAGGSVMSVPIDKEDLPLYPEEFRNKLLTAEQAQDIFEARSIGDLEQEFGPSESWVMA